MRTAKKPSHFRFGRGDSNRGCRDDSLLARQRALVRVRRVWDLFTYLNRPLADEPENEELWEALGGDGPRPKRRRFSSRSMLQDGLPPPADCHVDLIRDWPVPLEPTSIHGAEPFKGIWMGDSVAYCPARAVRSSARGKTRWILKPALRDKMRGLSLLEDVMREMEGRWPPGVGDGMKGCRAAVKSLRRAHLGDAPIWRFKCDVQDYYPSLPHELVLTAFEQASLERFVPFIRAFLGTPVLLPEARIVRPSTGIVSGNPIAHAIGMLCLLPVDKAAQRFCRHVTYHRVLDDILVFGKSEGPVEDAASAIVEKIRSLGLSVHSDKTVFRRGEELLVYLGHEFREKTVNVSTESSRRCRRHLDTIVRRCTLDARARRRSVTEFLSEVERELQDYLIPFAAFFSLVTTTRRLRQIDWKLARSLRDSLRRLCPGISLQDTTQRIARDGPRGAFRTYMALTHGRT